MRKLALLIVLVAAVGESGSRIAESCFVTAARQLTRSCAFTIARAVAPRDPVDSARRPPPIRVDDAEVLAGGSLREPSPAPALARAEPVSILPAAVLRLPISRDLGSVLAEAERKRPDPCSVLAQSSTEHPGSAAIG